METWIALLRGINVGGHRKLPMKQLIAILETLGCRNVRTYIQSGNAVFESDAARELDISGAIESSLGFRPDVLLLSRSELSAAVNANPFPEATSEPKTLHLFFLADSPAESAEEKLTATKSEREACVLLPSVLYLHTPDYLKASRVAQRAERLLGVSATARNWNSVSRILALATQTESPAEAS